MAFLRQKDWKTLAMPKKILFVHCESDLYGSNVSLVNLCANLDQNEFQPLVLLALPGPLKTVLEERGIKVFIRPMSYLRRAYSPSFMLMFMARYLPGIWGAAGIIRNHQIDLVHTNTSHVQAGAIAGRLLGTKVVWHVREIIPNPQFIVKPLYQFIGQVSDRIICISRAVLAHLESLIGPSKKLTCVYNAVDLDRFKPKHIALATRRSLGLPDHAPIIGLVGRITFWKGQDIFIQAVAMLSQKFPSARFLIVGDIDRSCYQDYYQGLMSLSRSLGIEDKIIFTGFRQDIPALMEAMDILVVPSTRPEPFGLVVLEAMAMNKPVIATNHGGAAEIIENQDLGFLVPSHQPGAIAEKIEFLLTHHQLRSLIGERARQHVEKNFTIKAYVENVQKIYRQVLS